MVLKKKIEKSRDDFEEIISRGGHVKSDQEKIKKKWVVMTLRITEDLIEDVEKNLEERVGMSRNSWILEAIQEKLKRSNNE